MADKNKKSSFEKLILGAVIGAAVGSVIGAAVAPDAGKKTRGQISDKIKDISRDLKEKARQNTLIEKAQERKPQSLFTKILNKFKKTDGKKIPTEESDKDRIF